MNMVMIYKLVFDLATVTTLNVSCVFNASLITKTVFSVLSLRVTFIDRCNTSKKKSSSLCNYVLCIEGCK